MANLKLRWTKEQEIELASLAKTKNITAQEIANRMTTRAVKKNAVISKLQNMHIRLPLSKEKVLEAAKKSLQKRIEKGLVDPKMVGVRDRTPKAVKPKPERNFPFVIARTVIVNEPVSPIGVTLDELTATSCRWPMGYPVKYCGKFRNKGHAYCTAHQALAVGQGTSGERSASRVPVKVSRYR